MRLYLSSYRLGHNPEELVKLVDSQKRVGIILNSLDGYTKESRDERLEKDRNEFESLGFTVDEVDLRKYFQNNQTLRDDLLEFDLIWVRGGNSFVLRRAMKQSGFDSIIKDLLEKDLLVYGGSSAGSVVMTPTLKGIDLMDDPDIVPDNYQPEIIWEGLSLVDYSIAPHYRSDHPESADTEKVVAYFEEQKMPYKALRDGQVIIVEGDKVRIAE